jgi:hypothetical protein
MNNGQWARTMKNEQVFKRWVLRGKRCGIAIVRGTSLILIRANAIAA